MLNYFKASLYDVVLCLINLKHLRKYTKDISINKNNLQHFDVKTSLKLCNCGGYTVWEISRHGPTVDNKNILVYYRYLYYVLSLLVLVTWTGEE